MRDARTNLSFGAAVGSLLVLYFVSGSPISLYSMWQEELGLSHAQLSMASMWYLLGTVVPLLFLPRISNHLGRRPATVMTLCVSVCGAATFAMVSDPSHIMMGRLIQGIASGMGSSTVAAYVVDLSVGLPKWVGPMITSSAPTLGLATGAFASGGLVTYIGVPAKSYFEAAVVLIAVFLILILVSKESMPRSPGLLRSLIPTITLPEGCARIYAACTMVFVSTWALGGFSQSFSSTIVSERLGVHDAMISAVVFTSLLLPNVIGSFFSKRFDTRVAQRCGLGMFTLFVFLMYISLAHLDNLVLFCLCSIVAGISQGIAFTAGVSELLGRATQAQRAGTFSTIYFTSYGGAAVPNLVVGLIAGDNSVSTILSWYVMLSAVMFVILMILTIRPYDKPAVKNVPTDGN